MQLQVERKRLLLQLLAVLLCPHEVHNIPQSRHRGVDVAGGLVDHGLELCVLCEEGCVVLRQLTRLGGLHLDLLVHGSHIDHNLAQQDLFRGRPYELVEVREVFDQDLEASKEVADISFLGWGEGYLDA